MINVLKREKYEKKIVPHIHDTRMIKVLVWQRRSGKSFMMHRISQIILEHPDVTAADIIYINMEDISRDHIRDYRDLHDAVWGYTYILIDEIQGIDQREKAIVSLKASQKHDIYITWSNAQFMEKKLSVLLGGRYLKFTIYPLDYKEYLQFHDKEDSSDVLRTYIELWGIPLLRGLESHLAKTYLVDIYNSIVLKDIIQINNLRRTKIISKIIVYLARHVGSLITAKSISDYYKSENIKVETNQVLDRLWYIQDAYIITAVSRYNIKWKTDLSVNQKYYFTDLGIRNYIAWWYHRLTDGEKMLENVVFCHLQSHGYWLKVWEILTKESGKNKTREIDFIASKAEVIVYIQVTLHISSEAVKLREFGNLQMIWDNYRKIVVSLDELYNGVYEGIEHIHLQEFLTSFE